MLSLNNFQNEVILIARLLIAILFVTSGWGKLRNYPGKVVYMRNLGIPLPYIAVVIAILIELPGGIVLMLGIKIQWMAILFAVFTITAAYFGHPFWKQSGADRAMNFLQFCKNGAILGAFLLLITTGAGLYSF
jgi:putative oxidoreductase